jgi:hypothetical protein
MKNDENKKYLMAKYVLSIEKYSKARESFVEYMSRHSSYYGAGKIRDLESIKMNAIDIGDNEMFE